MTMKRAKFLSFLLLLPICNWCGADDTNETSHDSSHDLLHDPVGLSPDLMCVDKTCRVTADNVWNIQNMIRSNQIIRFEEKILSMRQTVQNSNGFILVENVRNLLVMGHSEGSNIQCVSGTYFGFYFRNVTNVTISGLKFSNCGVPIPSHLERELDRSRDLPCDHVVCSSLFRNENATILVQDSTNVTLSNTDIVQSPGFALVAVNNEAESTQEYSLVMEDCSISQSGSGALLIHRLRGLLVRSTLNNSTIGITSTDASLEIRDSAISHCMVSSLESGSLVISGGLRIHQSSLSVRGQVLSTNRSRVVFTSNGEPTSLPALSATDNSIVDIEKGSKVVFAGFNLSANSSALLLVATELLIQDNSSLEFDDNFASNQSSLFCVLESSVSMIDRTSLIVHRNSARNAWIILTGFDSMWITGNDAVINITGNSATDGGHIAEFFNTDVTVHHNTTVSLQNNNILRGSRLVGVTNAIIAFYEDSAFNVVNNSAVDNSGIIMTVGDIVFYDNVEAVLVNNTVARESTVISLQPFRPVGAELLHYRQLILEQNEDEETRGGTNRRPPDKSPVEDLPPDSTFTGDDSSGYPRGLNDDLTGKDNQPIPPKSSSPPVSEVRQGIPGLLGRPLFGDVFSTNRTIPSVVTDNISQVIDFPNGTAGIGVPGIIKSIPQPTEGTAPLSIFEVRGENAILYFHSNTITDDSAGLMCMGCIIMARSSGQMVLTNNTCGRSSYVMLLARTNVLVRGRARVEISHNEMYRDSSAILSLHSAWRSEIDTVTSVVGNNASNGFSILFFTMIVEFNGTVLVKNNILSDFGVINGINSQVYFHGRLECSGNRAESGVISAENSDVFFTNESIFSSNTAATGGAISLISSVMHVSPNAVVNFTRNHAIGLGGAIHISNPRTTFLCDMLISTATACSIQVMTNSQNDCRLFKLTFDKNSAGIAGNAIYGGRTSACIPSNSNTYCTDCSFPNTSQIFQYDGVGDMSDLSDFTSDPTRVCFCDNGIPDCYKVSHDVTVHPGEPFHLSLAIVGYGLGTVPGSIVARTNARKVRDPDKVSFGSSLQYSQDIGTECQDITYSVISEEKKENIILAVNTPSFGRSIEEVEAVVNFQRTKNIQNVTPILRSPYDSVYETFFHIPIFVRVNLSECPVGFQLVSGRCVCHQILIDNNIDMCFIDNSTPIIHQPTPYWIGLPEDPTSPILIHPQCPFDYCQSDDLNITVDNPDSQCQYHRSGVLCGSCGDGRSMVLGSSECKKCSNSFVSLLVVFAVAGVALVALLTLLNMTVSVGTLNGLILFANIIQANRATFLPPSTSSTSVLISILSTFISWVNLDWGISTCFFDGLTTYVKTWLQFVFPLYILTIVGVIIVASYSSRRVTRIFGTNSVPVLATLVLLSYAKVLRILITAFSFTTLTGTQDYYSVVWLADGNVEYFEPKHAILFLTALLVLLVAGIPYTVTLTASPWIQRSKYRWLSKTYNKFKPLFDAYMGPYKDNCRYWTGMLLLARVVLIVLFSSIANTNTVSGPVLNLLLLTLSASALLTLTAAVKPYKTRLNNLIEIFYLALLLVFSAANLYASNSDAGVGNRDYVYIVLVGICFIAFLCMGIGHALYRIETVRHGTGTQLPFSKRPPHTPSDHEVESEVRETQITMSTPSADTSFIRERRDSMYRESVLDLNNTAYD